MLWLLEYTSENKIIKKEWGGLEVWEEGFKTIISETESLSRLPELAMQWEEPAEGCNTQYGGYQFAKLGDFCPAEFSCPGVVMEKTDVCVRNYGKLMVSMY